MTRGNIDMSKPLVVFVEKTPFHRGFGPAESADQPMSAALQEHRRRLQRELNVLADAVVQIDRRRRRSTSHSGRCSNAIARLISQFPLPGVPGSSVIMGGPPCAERSARPREGDDSSRNR